jgi:hypothetical protein
MVNTAEAPASSWPFKSGRDTLARAIRALRALIGTQGSETRPLQPAAEPSATPPGIINEFGRRAR